jgi:hypothetical protein
MVLTRWLTDEEIETAKQNGIPYQTWYGRIYRRGWDIERAITTPPNGKKTLKQLAEENGLNYSTVHERIYHRGWDKERALSTPLNDHLKGAKHEL